MTIELAKMKEQLKRANEAVNAYDAAERKSAETRATALSELKKLGEHIDQAGTEPQE